MPVIARGVENGTTGASILPYTHGLAGVTLSMDSLLITWLWISIALTVVLVLLGRIVQRSNSYLRHLSTLSASAEQQAYWSFDRSSFWPNVKKHLLYAPLGKKRHNREIQISKAMNVGTLPSRFHTILLLLYLGSNIAYCLILDYANQDKAGLIASVRGRSGVLATVNMVPLIAFAGRNNPLIPFLRISFDTFNLLHRWIGRIVAVEAVIHTCAWAANESAAEGGKKAVQHLFTDNFLLFGGVAVAAMVVIIVQACSPIRHAFYETFLHIHQLLAFFAVLGVYVHLESAKLPALPYIRLVVGLWVNDRLLRAGRLIYLNVSRRNGMTTVSVKALKGEACRVTFNLPRRVTIRPGSHVYVYIPSISLWMSHPFSVAWTDIDSEPFTGRRPLPRNGTPISPASLEKMAQHFPSKSTTPTSISLIVQAQTGFTRQLYDKACAAPDSNLNLTGFVEGPYAGHDSLASYGTVLLFAGGAGITHHLIQIRHLIACAHAGTVATRKIVLVWSVKTVDQLAWVQPWMDEILAMEGRREILTIKLFVTKPRNPNEIRSASTTVQMIGGRCQPGVMLDSELPHRIGATAVSVCGSGAFADEVRHATRERLWMGSLDFVEEAFTW